MSDVDTQTTKYHRLVDMDFTDFMDLTDFMDFMDFMDFKFIPLLCVLVTAACHKFYSYDNL